MPDCLPFNPAAPTACAAKAAPAKAAPARSVPAKAAPGRGERRSATAATAATARAATSAYRRRQMPSSMPIVWHMLQRSAWKHHYCFTSRVRVRMGQLCSGMHPPEYTGELILSQQHGGSTPVLRRTRMLPRRLQPMLSMRPRIWCWSEWRVRRRHARVE